MGHFVHSFAEETSATSLNDLQTTSLEWVTNAMSLQQLRKGKCTSTGYPIWMWWILKSCIVFSFYWCMTFSPSFLCWKHVYILITEIRKIQISIAL